MDNQNANYGGFPQNPPQQSPEPNPLEGHSQTVVMPDNNLRTQSMIESSRDVSERELAEQEARNAAMIRQQKAAVRHYHEGIALRNIIIIVIVVGILVAAAWVVINAIMVAQKPVAIDPVNPGSGDEPSEPTKYSSIEGYQCKTADCRKVATISNSMNLMFDSKYYTFDTGKNEAMPLNIEVQTYHSIEPFTWNKHQYLRLKPESGAYGVYDVSGNHQAIDFSYDDIYINIDDPVYKNMKQVEKNYIIGKINGSYRLINMLMGTEAMSAPRGIFVYDNVMVGYENEGRRYFYLGTESTPFLKAKSGDEVFFADKMIIHVDANNRIVYYATTDQTVVVNGRNMDTQAGKMIQGAAFTESQKKRFDAIVQYRPQTDVLKFIMSDSSNYRFPSELGY